MPLQSKKVLHLLVLALALVSCSPPAREPQTLATPQPAALELVYAPQAAPEGNPPLPVTAITPSPAAQSVAAGTQETYCLWPGDTLYDISLSAKVPADSVLAENRSYTGFAGSVIRLPAGSIPPAQWVPAQPVFNSIDQLPLGVSGFYLGYDNRKKQVALTFDIGYEAENAQLMKMLAERGIHATFFVVGSSVSLHPGMITEILENGHELGNHSWSHINMQFMIDEQIRAELERTEAAVQSAYPGATTKPFFRAPFGAINPTVLAVLKQAGYYPVGWTIDSHDWMEDISAPEMVQSVTRSVCPGAIIAMHDVNPANTGALPQILDFLEANGYAIVPLSTLLLPQE